MIRDLARKLARDRIVRHAADVDERERYPEESIRALIESGLYGIWVPEAYGGTEMGCLALGPGAPEVTGGGAAQGGCYARAGRGRSSSREARRRSRSICRASRPASCSPRTRSRSRTPAPT